MHRLQDPCCLKLNQLRFTWQARLILPSLSCHSLRPHVFSTAVNQILARRTKCNAIAIIMPFSVPAKPERMMSLPPLVMVVWVWPLVHVTICALLGSPEASSLASSHEIHTLTQFHSETQVMQLSVLIHLRAFDDALISAFMLNIHPALFFSRHAEQYLQSKILPHDFVDLLWNRKE